MGRSYANSASPVLASSSAWAAYTPRMSYAATYERARISRDPRFDGRFFVGVRTTGIYCRPVCPAVTPKRQNVEIFTTAAAAGEAGYRPCLRCRPECAPGSPAWNGTSTTVRRGLKLIANGALERDGVEGLAERLGVTDRHLRRLFQKHIGASPQAIAHTQRLHFAKSLIDQTNLRMADIAVAAGFGSTRRFNDAVRNTWGRAPRELRKLRASDRSTETLSIKLPCHKPYDWPLICGFLGNRAIPGVESAAGGVFRRLLRVDDEAVLISVVDNGDGLTATVQGATPASLFKVVQTIRDAFDVDAPIREIMDVLSVDPQLKRLARQFPGIRVPGAFDRFEQIVRAILGQQVSVKAATTLAGRIAERYGERAEGEFGGLDRLFPTPEKLARGRLETLGITSGRAAAIRRVASAVSRGELALDPAGNLAEFVDTFTSIKGIGDWTAQHVLMRGMKDPDAFPASDLGIIKALSEPGGARISPREAAERSRAFSPWRAYAALLLWHEVGAGG